VRMNDGFRNTEEYVADMINAYSPNVEYVSGYVNRTSRINVRCRRCGEIFSTTYHYVVHNKRAVACPACKAKKRCQKLIEQEMKRRKRKDKKGLQLSFRVCERCGSLFMPKRKKSRFCSKDCSRASYRVGNGDSRLHSWNVEDWNITLKKLAKRDGDKCWICGGYVDWNDYVMRGDTFIAGNQYPSIDHIIPLSKNGMHSWDNVALAHRICNSKKQAKIL